MALTEKLRDESGNLKTQVDSLTALLSDETAARRLAEKMAEDRLQVSESCSNFFFHFMGYLGKGRRERTHRIFFFNFEMPAPYEEPRSMLSYSNRGSRTMAQHTLSHAGGYLADQCDLIGRGAGGLSSHDAARYSRILVLPR